MRERGCSPSKAESAASLQSEWCTTAWPVFVQDIRFAQTADALNIAYAVSGRGYPLIRAATWLSNVDRDWRTAIFGPLFCELSSHYTLYRYNPRGYGLSEGGGDVSIDTFVADLDAVARHAKLKRFALWGSTSVSSLTAIAFAALHPDRVSHLVLSAPIARGTLRRPDSAPGEKERFRAFVKLVELGWTQRIRRSGRCSPRRCSPMRHRPNWRS